MTHPADDAWRKDAACLEAPDPTVFFRETEYRAVHEARGICRACLVRSECLRDAMTNAADIDNGIRAGLTPPQRRQLHEESGVRIHRGGPPAAMCGTANGYRSHYRKGEKPCEPCRHANAEYLRDREERRRIDNAS